MMPAAEHLISSCGNTVWIVAYEYLARCDVDRKCLFHLCLDHARNGSVFGYERAVGEWDEFVLTQRRPVRTTTTQRCALCT